VLSVIDVISMREKAYAPDGVYSKRIYFTIDGGHVAHVEFFNDCEGNLHGIASLVEGMEVDEVIRRLRGIDYCSKDTSCPNQLAHALEEAKN
jgi:uncharacterized protein (TIGR03905 family)